jgi:hypothetical protein
MIILKKFKFYYIIILLFMEGKVPFDKFWNVCSQIVVVANIWTYYKKI